MYRLRCFGTMALEDGGVDSDYSLRSRKHWALLVYLLAHRGRTFPRERLARLFWDTEPRLARHSLSQALYDIRTTLPGVDFDSSTSQVGAGAEAVAYDGETFEEAVRTDELSRAVRLYGGRFAPDVEDAGNSDFTRWLESERQRYRRLAEMVLYRHVRESRDRADWGEMCVSALRLLDMNPLSEDAHRALMRGLWLQGDRPAAVRHFEQVEDFLARQLPGGIGQETLDLVERIRATRPGRATSPDDGGRRTAMVGRDEEFGVLEEYLEELREEGRSGLIRVHGEAGMGKTRLLEEFRGLVELEGARVLDSRCYAAESDVPYGPIVDALDALAEEASAAADGDEELTYYQLGHLFPEAFDRPPEAGDALAEPDSGRRRLYEEVADLLRRAAGREPVVWLVEDVHWIDPSSASLLHYLARRLSDVPVLIVITARTHEETSGPARELLEDDAASLPRVSDVVLDPLEHGETERLVDSAGEADPDAETVDRIHVLAGGNPFYALELLRASAGLGKDNAREVLASGSGGLITESLRTLLDRRLRDLPPEAVRIMETVAVAGRHASSAAVREVTDFPASRIANLAGDLYDRGLLRDAGGRLEFSHDITRDFVYGRMGDLQRSALHLSVGELLDGRTEVVDPATLARHFHRGGERARAYRYALEAAREAERRHAHEEAIQMAEMAVELAADEKDKAAALWPLAKAEFSAMDFVSAREHFQSFVECEAADNAESSQHEVYFYLARIVIKLNQWPDAQRWLKKAEAQLNRKGTLRQQLECLHLQLKIALKASHLEEAREIRAKIKSIAPADPSGLTVESRALIAISLAAFDFYYESAAKTRKRLEAVNNVAELPVYIQLTLLQLKGSAQHRSGHFTRSRATHRTSLKIAREYNDILGQLTAINNLMCECLERGRMERAMEYHAAATPLIQLAPISSEMSTNLALNRAESLFNLERYRDAIDVYRKLNRMLQKEIDGQSDVAIPIKSGLGLCLLATNDLPKAATLYESMLEHKGHVGGVPPGDLQAWFIGFMKWMRRPQEARRFMVREGHAQLQYQEVAARRILWLVRLFEKCLGPTTICFEIETLYQTEAAERLRELDNGWFLRFSKRWLQATMSGEINRTDHTSVT